MDCVADPLTWTILGLLSRRKEIGRPPRRQRAHVAPMRLLVLLLCRWMLRGGIAALQLQRPKVPYLLLDHEPLEWQLIG